VESQSQFGTLIAENDAIYEVIESFIPSSTDTISSLLTAGFIRRAYRRYSDFETLDYTGFEPSYFAVDEIKFVQPNPKTVQCVGGSCAVL
jgi:hypothetical protein